MRMTSYDRYVVQWQDGNLIACVYVGSNEYELKLQAGEAYHTFYSDSITVEAKDSLRLINGILSDLGVSDVEMDDSPLCYQGLEITEKGIFYSSMKNSALTTKIGDDWDVKLGNSTSFAFSGDLLGSDDDDEGSYYDLAKKSWDSLVLSKETRMKGRAKKQQKMMGISFRQAFLSLHSH